MAQTIKQYDEINSNKKNKVIQLLTIQGTNIAFSAFGLKKVCYNLLDLTKPDADSTSRLVSVTKISRTISPTPSSPLVKPPRPKLLVMLALELVLASSPTGTQALKLTSMVFS